MTTNISFDAAMLDRLSADTGIGITSLIGLIDEGRVKFGRTTDESVALIRANLVGPAAAPPKAGG